MRTSPTQRTRQPDTPGSWETQRCVPQAFAVAGAGVVVPAGDNAGDRHREPEQQSGCASVGIGIRAAAVVAAGRHHRAADHRSDGLAASRRPAFGVACPAGLGFGPVAFPDWRRSPSRTRRVFFGRDAEIAELLDRLHPVIPGQANRLIAVVGPSGAGKSSLVQAGVVPRLANRLRFDGRDLPNLGCDDQHRGFTGERPPPPAAGADYRGTTQSYAAPTDLTRRRVDLRALPITLSLSAAPRSPPSSRQHREPGLGVPRKAHRTEPRSSGHR